MGVNVDINLFTVLMDNWIYLPSAEDGSNLQNYSTNDSIIMECKMFPFNSMELQKL